MSFIDRVPTAALVVLALMMAGAPFMPEPHLVEKYRMFSNGTLTKSIDIFDVIWHIFPTILLIAKLARQSPNKS